MMLNAYPITAFPEKSVYQYEVCSFKQFTTILFADDHA